MKIVVEEGPGNHTTLHFVADNPAQSNSISATPDALLEALRYGIKMLFAPTVTILKPNAAVVSELLLPLPEETNP